MAAMVRSVDYDGESKGRENQGLRSERVGSSWKSF
jgi:hypothetical protein